MMSEHYFRQPCYNCDRKKWVNFRCDLQENGSELGWSDWMKRWSRETSTNTRWQGLNLAMGIVSKTRLVSEVGAHDDS